ncbi:MAG: hypothetical protein PHQ86_02755 [Dehalococcoidales bacterium]|nr:hypothetical protein [Dehalococcoidales bacterium]
MAVRSKLYNTGEFELANGEINERLPVITDGLIYHFPFDGNSNAVYDLDNYILNIGLLSIGASGNVLFANLLDGDIAYGDYTGDSSGDTATALTYDLMLADNFAWAVTSANLAFLKGVADSGGVCWATGNDTQTNVFVATVQLIGTETTTHGVVYNDNSDIETYLGFGMAGDTVDCGSSDPNYYIQAFNSVDGNIIPLYYHSFNGDSAIMGYLYLPNNNLGGSLYFDEFGQLGSYSGNYAFLRHLLEWQLNRRTISSLVTTDSNNTYMADGISVEAATTNIINSGHASYPNYRPYSGLAHSNYSTIVTDIPPPIEGMDVYRIGDSALDTQNMRFSFKFDVVTEDVWDVDVTYSIYVWLPEQFKDRFTSTTEDMYQNTLGVDWHSTQGYNWTYSFWGAGTIESDHHSPDLTKTNCWQKYSITGKALVASRYDVFGDTGVGTPDNKYIAGYLRINFTEGTSASDQPSNLFLYLSSPQFEEKAYHTEFVDGSRAGVGNIIIEGLNIDTSSEDFTLNFKIDTNKYVGASSTRRILLNNFGWLWRYFPTSTDASYRRFIWDWVVTGTRLYNDLNATVLFTTGGYETITITYDHDASTYGQVKFFRNGDWWETDDGNVDCTRGVIDYIQIYDLGASIKDLSIYNKVLSDEQIYELGKSSFSITSNGDLITNEVREFPDIPSTYYTRYFPLDEDANDKSNLISPATDSDGVYENRARWQGQATINLSDLTYVNRWSNTGTREDLSDGVTPLFEDQIIRGIKQLTAGQSAMTFGQEYSSPSTVYSASVYMWIATVGTENYAPYFREYTASTNYSIGTLLYNGDSLTITQLPQRRWIRLESTNKTTAADTSYLAVCCYIGNAGTVIYMTAPQIEAKPFVTPFVDGTRANSYLYYASTNLTQAHGAICGWYLFNEAARTWRGPANNNDFSMLFSTYGTSEANKLNVRSYYSYSTGLWYVQTSNNVPNTTSTAVTISEGWHFICLAWDDSTGYSKFFVDQNKEFDKASYLPDAYDSDIRIGDWGAASPWGSMNQYVRDLIILDYYPDDDEVYDIYRKTMSAYSDKLRINHEIIEGDTLS